MVTVQATARMVAGACSSIITTPIDTIKTRLQVSCSLLLLDCYILQREMKRIWTWSILGMIRLVFFIKILWLILDIGYLSLVFFIQGHGWLWCWETISTQDYKDTPEGPSDGWWGFYRGFGPRFLNMSLYGTTMIVTYELISMSTFLLSLFNYWQIQNLTAGICFYFAPCHVTVIWSNFMFYP